jgi:serine/threonine-protein kinase HipA
MTLAEVKLWGRTIGAVSLEDGGRFAAFQYAPAFAGSGIEVSPITMPLSDRVYVFPNLTERTFLGLPGLLADSLPDRFGNALVDAWLATQGRTPESFNIVARNQDDHVKNIAFLMDKDGHWSLAPAFDVTYSYNPLKAR